jgi:hypothetical protein
VLTKGIVETSEHSLVGVLTSPEFVPWILVALTGMIFQQSAFRAGALTASLPTMTVAKPVVAGLLGVLVLGETLNTDGPKAFVLIAAVSVVFVATIALARGEAATIVETEHAAGSAPQEVPSRDPSSDQDFGPFSDRLAVVDSSR